MCVDLEASFGFCGFYANFSSFRYILLFVVSSLVQAKGESSYERLGPFKPIPLNAVCKLRSNSGILEVIAVTTRLHLGDPRMTYLIQCAS